MFIVVGETVMTRLTLLTPVALLAAACASTPVVAPNAALPDPLKPDASQRALLSHHARGVQIYRCEAADGAFKWTFVAPQAELFANAQSQAAVGSHGAGPFWQAQDGSKVVGKVKSRADAPAAGAIPWLLLSTAPEGAQGKLASVTHIQRINTVGGVAPAQGCGGAGDVGQQARVPYTADYVYFAAK
jgi:Protein of unknown function (DUF3455)